MPQIYIDPKEFQQKINSPVLRRRLPTYKGVPENNGKKKRPLFKGVPGKDISKKNTPIFKGVTGVSYNIYDPWSKPIFTRYLES